MPPTAREAAAVEAAANAAAPSGRRAAASASARIPSEDDMTVSLLEPPTGVGAFASGPGGGGISQVLVVVALRSAARYLTYACSM
jgi:hypothetical protein